MQIKTIAKIIGILLSLFSMSMIPPTLVALHYGDSSPLPYLIALILTLGCGLVLWGLFRHQRQDLKTRDGFLVVVLFWVVLSGFAAIPMMLATQPHDSLTDAVFETVSGFTTTGASVVKSVDQLPHAMRYYRQQLQFLGGMGIIVLAVAVLPMLGIGGMQLFRAETPGPLKDSKLTPRITETAKALWFIYLGLTVACIIAYYWSGMFLIDAVGEAFATISTGGFSMHDSGFAYYHSPLIEWVGALFMIMGATNFSLHFIAARQRQWFHYWQDEEFRRYFLLLTFAVIIITLELLNQGTYQFWFEALTKSVFNVVSLATTTGFQSASFELWPSFIPVLIMFLALLGGCAGSTTGGMKMIRGLLLLKQSRREIERLIHPQAVMTIKFGKQSLPEPIIQAMWGFLAAYIGLSCVIILILMATGLDLTSAFGMTAAGLANAGAAIGDYAGNFAALSTTAKWTLVFAMLAGRLEIFTLLILLSPSFWRK